MNLKTYNLTVVTPLFVGGATSNQEGNLEKAIKSAIAWWYRALNFKNDVPETRKSEFEIFGGIMGEKATSSSFYIDVSICESSGASNWDFNTSIDIVDKIGGGVSKVDVKKYMSYGKDSESRVYWPGTTITLKIYNKGSEKLSVDLLNAIDAFLCFGSIGGKALNGFGRASLNEMDISGKFNNLMNGFKGREMQNFPTFSKETKLYFLSDSKSNKKLFDNSYEAFIELAKHYREAKVGNNKDGSLKKGIDSCAVSITGRHYGKYRSRFAKPFNIPGKDRDGKFNWIDRNQCESIHIYPRLPKSIRFIIHPVINNREIKYVVYVLYMPWKVFGKSDEDQKLYIDAYQKFFEILQNRFYYKKV